MTPNAPAFTRFLGFDVSKDKVTVFDSQSQTCRDIANSTAELRRFLKPFQDENPGKP